VALHSWRATKKNKSGLLDIKNQAACFYFPAGL
jgi:hypothetical protein